MGFERYHLKTRAANASKTRVKALKARVNSSKSLIFFEIRKVYILRVLMDLAQFLTYQAGFLL